MSGYKIVVSQMNNQVLVVKALERICPDWAGKIEVGQPGRNQVVAKGAHGDVGCDIVVHQQDMLGQVEDHGYSDLGLRWNAQRRAYEWVISDCDRGNYNSPNGAYDPEGQHSSYNKRYGNYSEVFTGDVVGLYTALQAIEDHKARGAVVEAEPQLEQNPDLGRAWKYEVSYDEAALVSLGVAMPASAHGG